jgi:hypothetical protein
MNLVGPDMAILQSISAVWTEARPYLLRYISAWTPLAAGYIAVFLITLDLSFGWALLTALANIIVPLLLGIPVFWLFATLIVRASSLVQLAAHIVLSVSFTLLWHSILVLELAALRSLQTGVYEPVRFVGAALTWQLFQGLTLYALIIAGSYVILMRVQGSLLIAGLATKPDTPSLDIENRGGAQSGRLFFKHEGEFVPLEPVDISVISGADDYCEIDLGHRTPLIKMTLGDMQDRLGAETFIRIHRSHLINLDKIATVEPRAGGGLTVQMQSGRSVHASRSGADALKPFLIN